MKIFEVIVIENDEPLVDGLPYASCPEPMEGCSIKPPPEENY